MTTRHIATHPSIGDGIYGLSEVVRYTRASSDTIRYWFMGHRGRPDGILRRPGISAAAGRGPDRPVLTVSFHDLIDAYVVARFREHRVTLQYLRKVYDRLIHEFRHPHPFSRKDLFTDGRSVFVSCDDRSGNRFLKELLTSQQNFEQIIREYLTQIIYDESTSLAVRWRIGSGVVIDPARRFGKPIVESCGLPTCVLATAFRANHQDGRLVADWFDVTEADVAVAVDFEKAFSRAA